MDGFYCCGGNTGRNVGSILELLHFHIGSQISSILVMREAMREASHAYCELARMGAPMVHSSLSYSIHEGLWVCLYGIHVDCNGPLTI